MANQARTGIDPAKVFEQADCFYQALYFLCNVHPDNDQVAVTLGEPVMVLGALTIELFLKCLACIETGIVPRGHNLKELFDKLSEPTRQRIQQRWDDGITRHRAPQWDDLEKRTGVALPRDLPTALAFGSDAFERLRYSYEGNTEDLLYCLQDLPALLGRIILEMRPEYDAARRKPLPIPASRPH